MMKLIIAYIKPHKLAEVTTALHRVRGLTGMSAIDVRGFGRGRAEGVRHTITENYVQYVPGVRLEVFCIAEIAEEVAQTIEREAHTGLRGDGKIYMIQLDDAIRISTGERGEVGI